MDVPLPDPTPHQTSTEEGRAADATWYALIVQSVVDPEAPGGVVDMVNYARYVDKVVKIDGEWYFAEVRPTPSRSWDLAGGWRA